MTSRRAGVSVRLWHGDQFWRGLSLGVHVGHGETILQPGVLDDEQSLWWSKGGELRGTSLLRVVWLRAHLTTIPELSSLEPLEFAHGECSGTMLVKQGEFALFHLREAARCTLSLPACQLGLLSCHHAQLVGNDHLDSRKCVVALLRDDRSDAVRRSAAKQCRAAAAQRQ